MYNLILLSYDVGALIGEIVVHILYRPLLGGFLLLVVNVRLTNAELRKKRKKSIDVSAQTCIYGYAYIVRERFGYI